LIFKAIAGAWGIAEGKTSFDN